MSAEHSTHHPERDTPRESGLEAAAAERMEQLRHQPERSQEQSAEQRAEAAREVIHRPEAKPEPEPAPAAEKSPQRSPRIPLINAELNYAHTLASVRRHLSPVSQQFSRAIHHPVVEKTSEVLEKTVARPSVMNGALWTAVVVGGIFYFFAHTYGYPLSGSTFVFSLLAGAIIGLIAEAVWRAFKHGER
jgi:hypothetical protein